MKIFVGKKIWFWFLVLGLFTEMLTGNESEFEKTITRAKGQKVYFNAWGGANSINEYIKWAIREVKKKYDVNVKHVKINDTATVVARILAEKKAGNDKDGSIDLIWINGENFKAMKKNKLLYGPFSDRLPNIKLVDFEGKPSTLIDFSEPVDGLEVPWGMAQLVFIYDQARVKSPPKNYKELLQFAKKHPGRVTYSKLPDFHGTSFIKQILLEIVQDDSIFQKPVKKSQFRNVTRPLWKYLDELHRYLWRQGKGFPSSLSMVHQLLDDGELLLSFSFNPNEASNLISKGELPDTVRTYVHNQGMLGNTHFLAIPYNSSAREGAEVFINFLLSPEAQAKKSDPSVWGDPTVLKVSALDNKDQLLFSKISKGKATLNETELGTVLLEPHASWGVEIEKEWIRRYGK